MGNTFTHVFHFEGAVSGVFFSFLCGTSRLAPLLLSTVDANCEVLRTMLTLYCVHLEKQRLAYPIKLFRVKVTS